MLFKHFKYTIVGLLTLLLSCNNNRAKYNKMEGNVFGTTFHLQYKSDKEIDYSSQIEALFNQLNQSLSGYHHNSKLSYLNKHQELKNIDPIFREVFLLSKNIHYATQGYFDPTIGKMAQAWGFGKNENVLPPNNKEVDSLMQFVGFDKVSLHNNTINKENIGIELDFNAIAKGFGADLVGRLLEKQGIYNYLIEIGGEIRCRGKNEKGNRWSIGIEQPNFDNTRSIQKITTLSNESMATSGNYRKFKTDPKTGLKYAHTLDPFTGKPAKTNLLSVSVIGKCTCAEVDGYATALMAMGFKKALHFSKMHPRLKVFYIYLENNQPKIYTNIQNLQAV